MTMTSCKYSDSSHLRLCSIVMFYSWLHVYSTGIVVANKLESLTQHETSSTVCLRLCSDGSSVCYSTITLNFDL